MDVNASLGTAFYDWSSELPDVNTTVEEEEIPPYTSRPETYIVPVLFAIIFIVGTLGNGTLILVFIKHKKMRNVPNTYIFSLALGDMLVILTSVPFTSTIYTMDTWPFGVLICKISEFAKDISIGVSVFTLTALSVDRFFAIVDPMRKLQGGGATRCTLLSVFCVWVTAILLALPAAIFSYIRVFKYKEKEFKVCYPFPEAGGDWYPRMAVWIKFAVYYSTPLCIISVFYSLMARHLVLSTRILPGESHRQVRAREKVAKMVLAFVFIFAICFLPQQVFTLWFHNTDPDENYNAFWHALRIAGFCMSYINSCINPIALFCISRTFRKYFKRYLLCCCQSKMARSPSMSMTSTRRMRTTKTSLKKRGDWELVSVGGRGKVQSVQGATVTHP